MITVEGRRHLGAAVGTRMFTELYVQEKVSGWDKEVERVADIAATQHHAAYTAFTHGLASRWTYLARTIPDIADLLQPLEDMIRQKILLSTRGQNAFSDDERWHNHLDVLEEVLSQLEKHSFCLKREKCQFLMSSIVFLGHQIDASGIRTTPDKVDAVVKAPPPKNVSELRSLFGAW